MGHARSVVVARAVAVFTLVVAVVIPRQEIAHLDPEPGGQAKILYDYLVVTRISILAVGLGLAGAIVMWSRQRS